MNDVTVSGRAAPPLSRGWRVTTAARVFVIAMVAGQAISSGLIGDLGVTLLALVVLAAVACAVELESPHTIARWIPVAEGILAATILGTSDAPVSPILGYLAVPPVVAGIRHGWVNTVNTALATGILLTTGYLAADSLGSLLPEWRASLPWLTTGLGTGLLASWLTRSQRAMEEGQAPLLAAHRLLCELRELSRRRHVQLDSLSVGHRLLDEVSSATQADRAAIFLRLSGRDFYVLAEVGQPAVSSAQEQGLAARCMRLCRPVHDQGVSALPLRVGEQVYGSVLVRPKATGRLTLDDLSPEIAEYALRLDTALAFEDVRAMATTEERSRLAREIHDGVAQEVASLGYLVDELATTTHDPQARSAAIGLRDEVTRVVSELRLSIFDLRHGVDEAHGLAGALSSYVQEVSSRSDLRVHLSLAESSTWLSPTVRSELLRIAQEAITNVRKHAQAKNLWVTLATDARGVRLEIADDGRGTAESRPRHYGMSTMWERANLINANLDVCPRPEGGTLVTILTSNSDSIDQRELRHADFGNARR